MTTYRNIGPEPLSLPTLALGRDVAAAGDEDGGDEFDSDVDVVHPLLERQVGSSWEPTVVEEVPAERKPQKASGSRKSTRGGKA